MILADGRILTDETAENVAAKVAAAMVRLHHENPIYAEGIAQFFHAPPSFGALEITMRHGKVDGVRLTTTLPKA